MKLRILLYKYINQTLNKVKISESVDLRGKSLYIREKTVVYVRQAPVVYIREQTVYMHPTWNKLNTSYTVNIRNIQIRKQ